MNNIFVAYPLGVPSEGVVLIPTESTQIFHPPKFIIIIGDCNLQGVVVESVFEFT